MLAVTGLGMVSAVGLDVAASCAAARAGIRRITPVANVTSFDETEGADVPVMAHQVPGIPPELAGFERLLELSVAAIADLRHNLAGSGANDTEVEVGLLLVLPSGAEQQAWIEQLRREPDLAQPDADPEASSQQLTEQQQRLRERLLDELAARAELRLVRACTGTILGDQVGFVEALEQADRWIAAGKCKTCWIGGIDSYVNPTTLRALAGLRMLRTPDNPVGTIPGEMACFVALSAAPRPGEKPTADTVVVEGHGQDPGSCSRFADDPPRPDPLWKALAAARAKPAAHFVLNLNGDPSRSVEWGELLVRRAQAGQREDTDPWYPPLCFGEIGAATGPAAVAMLARAWQRGYAKGDHASICLLGNTPPRGAIALSLVRGSAR